jgi:energy-coupling factor transporter ATP-binding protein EcfA2
MLTKLTIRNFKVFDEVELELGDRVVLIGPNNAGKTTALQALALWDIGLKRWMEKRGTGEVPAKRPGVTINRRDLIAVPVPGANLLWRDLHVRSGTRANGKPRTENVLIDIIVDGVDWSCGLEFDYANEESFYCRPLRLKDATRMPVPEAASGVRIAYLPPMSGLAANETRLDRGAISVRIGEGRTADVLRNLCYQILVGEDGETKWQQVVEHIQGLFGTKLDKPQYIAERGEITMTYRTRENVQLDLSASGRGQQQTLLLLAHMTANPASVLLLDEPDAHLEILRQRQIYRLLGETADRTGSQIIAASHSEVVLNEAADRDVLIAFVGRPHRIDDRGSQVVKSLKEIGFEHYLQAQEKGWVLYLEGSTDLAILTAFARRLEHPAAALFDCPYVHYVANQPRKAQDHFYGVREAKPDLVGVAVYDRLEQTPPSDPNLIQLMWRRRELENYLCRRDVLVDFAGAEGCRHAGELFETTWREQMTASIDAIEKALDTLGEPSPWGPDIKASDAFLDRVFKDFYKKLQLPNLMSKTDYHRLADYLPREAIDGEITDKLDAILDVAMRAHPRER